MNFMPPRPLMLIDFKNEVQVIKQISVVSGFKVDLLSIIYRRKTSNELNHTSTLSQPLLNESGSASPLSDNYLLLRSCNLNTFFYSLTFSRKIFVHLKDPIPFYVTVVYVARRAGLTD